MSADQPRAKDLLREGEIQPPTRRWARTVDRIDRRRGRRPCGNSARTWAKVDADDPFRPPRQKRREHRTVYASGRFVRIDKVTEQQNPPEPDWLTEMRREAKDRRVRPSRQTP